MTEPASGAAAAPTPSGGRRRLLIVIAAAVVAAVAATGVAVAARAHPSDSPVGGPVGGPQRTVAAPVGAGPTTSTGLATVDPEDGDAPPTRVRIPSIGVDSGLDALHLDATGVLTAPSKYAVAGWYADGTLPGDVGPAVIAGHVDTTSGPAVFYRLVDLRVGSAVQVQRGGQWLSFHVVRVSRYPKNAFPTAQVYGPTPDAQLRLITCGGAFDRGRRSYIDNIVVFAVRD